MVSLRMIAASFVACLALACGDVQPLGDASPASRLDDAPPVMDIAATALAPAHPRTLLGPPYPIILVHGFSGWDDAGPLEYFFGIRDMLQEAGNDVTTPALPPYTSSSERARVLATVIDEVLERSGKAKVHLIGHSQGGVDVRRVVSHGGMDYADRIASVTTISTPHDGTAVADLAEEAPEGVLNPAGQFLGWFVGAVEGEPPGEAAWASDDTSDAWTPDLAASIHSLTPGAARDLAAHMPMPPEVPFFSVAGVSNLRSLDNAACAASLWERPNRIDDVDPLFVGTGAVLSLSAGGDLFEPTPNDGLVTVDSARDPASTFLGCVPADHIDEIGQVADLIPGLLSGWDHKGFYRRLVDNLRTTE